MGWLRVAFCEKPNGVRNGGRVRHKEAKGCVAPTLISGIISYAASISCLMHVHVQDHLTTIICQF